MDQGAVVLVTGGSSGIGQAAARQLARKGCRVAVNYRENEAGAAETVAACEEAGGEAFALCGDVADDSRCRAMAEAVEARWGRLDGLVNNAGTTRFHDPFDLEGLTADDFASSYAVNVTGAFQMARAAVPAMKRSGGGAIVNVSSFAAAIGAGSSIAYTASKGAVLAMTRELAVIHARENIRVNALSPGPLRTELLMSYLDTDEKRQRRLVHVPMGRFGEAAEMAAAALFLASDESSYMTGANLLVDGGLTAAYVTPE